MRLRVFWASLVALLLAVLPLPARAAPVPDGASWTEVYFASLDGTPLHADLLRPAGGCPAGGCPVIVSVGPYFGSGSHDAPSYTALNEGPAPRFFDFVTRDFPGRGNLFDQGYAWLQVDSRGWGGSGGCGDLGGLEEQLDVVAAVSWAGTQPWSNGKVGMWGKSYDGWTQVMALAHSPPHLEAVVIQSPLIEGYAMGYENGVHHAAGWYATPGNYTVRDLLPPSLTEMTPEEGVYPVAGTATDPCWAEHQAVIAAGWDRSLEYWRERDIRARAGRNDDVAVFWTHGFNDINTKPDQIFPVYGRLNTLPKSRHRAWFGQWAHDRPNDVGLVGRAGFLEEALDWFDHHLKGLPFQYGANERNVVEVQDNEGRWRTEAQYPPADARLVTIPLRPGTYVDNQNTSANPGYWSASQPLPYDVRIAGEPTLRLSLDIPGAFANVVGVLYEVNGLGHAVEISRGAYRASGDGEIELAMHPRDHVVRAGRRLAFHVSAGHPEYFPHPSMSTVTVAEGSVSIPFLTYNRVANLRGVRAAASAYSRTVNTATLLVAAVQWEPPPPMLEYPDDATRESVQPTVTTPGG